MGAALSRDPICSNKAAVSAAVDAAVAQAAREEQLQIAEQLPRVLAWCKNHGYSDISSAKKTWRGVVKYPLHSAVKHDNTEMVALLLLCGAGKDVRDSKGRTPKDLAKNAEGF